VILTPDDVVQLRGDLLRDDDGPDEREIRGQARPNVYYEAGIADTLGRERTVIIEIGNVKSFSDAAGRHVVRYDGTPGKRHALAERLRLAGLDVDTQGNDWLTAGEVRGPIEAASAALAAGALRIERTVVNREDLEDQLQMLNGLYEGLQSKSRYDDFSDLPQESLQYVMQAQTFVDRVAAGTTYAAETDRVREREPHVRIPSCGPSSSPCAPRRRPNFSPHPPERITRCFSSGHRSLSRPPATGTRSCGNVYHRRILCRACSF